MAGGKALRQGPGHALPQHVGEPDARLEIIAVRRGPSAWKIVPGSVTTSSGRNDPALANSVGSVSALKIIWQAITAPSRLVL